MLSMLKETLQNDRTTVHEAEEQLAQLRVELDQQRVKYEAETKLRIELEHSLAKLSAELDGRETSTDKKLAQQQHDVEDLRAQLEQQQAHAAAAREQLKASEARVSHAATETSVLERSLEQLKAQVASDEAEKDGLAADVLAANEVTEQLQQSLADVRSKMVEQTKLLHTEQDRVEDADSRTKAADAHIEQVGPAARHVIGEGG